MKSKHIYLLLLVLVASRTAAAQSEGELQIPVENDNQFPPDNHIETESVIEGSGEGAGETTTDISPPPELEDIENRTQLNQSEDTPSDDLICPDRCLCNVEGPNNEYIVNCAGSDLTEFPSQIDERTSVLNLQNNKLTVIPKKISDLKNLKVLNANDNSIKELEAGSVSELTELTTLKIANNRLIDYPNDLKNSLILSKLEELDLGGNDMRTTLTADIFSNFNALRKLTLPTTTPDFNEDLCAKLKGTLEIICTEKCGKELHECQSINVPISLEDQMLEAKLPGTLLAPNGDDSLDVESDMTSEIDNENTESTPPADGQIPTTEQSKINSNGTSISNFSLRVDVDAAPQDSEQPKTIENTSQNGDNSNINTRISDSNVGVGESASNSTSIKTDTTTPVIKEGADKNVNKETSANIVAATSDIKTEGDDKSVKTGATTSETKTGGVDKSVIGIIVAGMVVVVAGVTIKKNWTSIKKRFSSSPTPGAGNERNGTANGATPEEVPLQDKSPV